MLGLYKDLRVNLNVLKVHVWIELKTSVVNTKLGFIWWILDPLFMMLIYYFVFGILFGARGPDFHIFILCGLVAWQWFNRSVVQGTSAFTRNKSLIKQTNIPYAIYILAPILVQLVFALFGFAIVLLFSLKLYLLLPLKLVPILIVQIFFTFGLCLFFSIANVHIPDAEKFIQYVLRFWFYLSVIFYSPARVLENPHIPAWAKEIFFANPFVTIITAYRNVMIYEKGISWNYLLFWFVVGIVLMQLGLLLLRKEHNKLPKMI